VYVTDWGNARDVPLYQGRFGFDEYVAHLIPFPRCIGPACTDGGVPAVCRLHWQRRP